MHIIFFSETVQKVLKNMGWINDILKPSNPKRPSHYHERRPRDIPQPVDITDGGEKAPRSPKFYDKIIKKVFIQLLLFLE